MSRIITVAEDLAAFNGLIDLIGTAATPDEVDANPLFQAAEAYIIGQVPSAALPDGRTHAQRATIVSATQFCGAWYMLSGGGKTATKGETIAGGALKSETVSIGEVTKSQSYETGGSTSVTIFQNIDDRLTFFKDQCDQLLEEIGGAPPPSGLRFYVGKTRSRRSDKTSVYRNTRENR